MLISKFDLHRNEWLDLVFANRNKEYGAYELRQHSADNTVKAMGITFLSITAAVIAGSILLKPSNIVAPVLPDLVTITEVTTIIPPKKEEVKQPESATSARSTKFLVPVVTSDPVTEIPPDITKIEGAVGPVTNDDPNSIILDNLPEAVSTGKGEAEALPKIDNTIYNKAGVDVMPEPDGGANGWRKFLEKNLRYPSMATDAGKSGKVWVSFVVEKDGQISNVKVDQGAGYGMDEEALRVLKLSKKWKPGLQRGEPVRVKYTLPLNFVLTD
ncbi:MAG: energy transducer TonB [Sphingobacteriaceae bacterium]|nr:MAG: energy transducer TonB [Sphingobacteriaceae bacterium]